MKSELNLGPRRRSSRIQARIHQLLADLVREKAFLPITDLIADTRVYVFSFRTSYYINFALFFQFNKKS